jgi:hypothetical protein
MLKDFIKIQFIIILILILNVVATKKVKLPQENSTKESLTTTDKKAKAPKVLKNIPLEISYIGKNQAIKDLIKNRF